MRTPCFCQSVLKKEKHTPDGTSTAGRHDIYIARKPGVCKAFAARTARPRSKPGQLSTGTRPSVFDSGPDSTVTAGSSHGRPGAHPSPPGVAPPGRVLPAPIRCHFRKLAATGRRFGFPSPHNHKRGSGTGVTQRGRRAVLLIVAVTWTAMAAGCGPSAPLAPSSRPDQTGSPSSPSFAQFSDIPVPSGAEMNLERSLVLGDRDSWIGRLAMTVPGGGGRVYDFYFSEMPKFGWAPITSVRAETSVLAFSRGDRVATIQIRERTIGGADVSLTVSPRGRPARPDAPPAFDRSGGIRTMPLR